MRNNKKAIWILLPAVLSLWGIIAFRVSKAMGDDEKTLTVAATTIPVVQSKVDNLDYELMLNYNDPFLKGRKVVVKEVVPKPSSKPKKTEVKKTVKKLPLKWPDIHYHGLIGSKGGGSTIILNVVGQSWFMSAGELKEELKLLKVHEDSVVIEYKGKEKRTYYKNR